VFYRVVDDEVFVLLDVARGIIGRTLESRQALADELAAE
jgi:hypothetical protein